MFRCWKAAAVAAAMLLCPTGALASYTAGHALCVEATVTHAPTLVDCGAAPQASDSDLTSWAAITRASGFDTFAGTPSSANLRSLITDETGSGALYFAGGNAGTPSAIILSNATSLPLSALANLGTTTTVLHGNAAGAPTFSAIDLTADVTGILPGANGGTGNGFTAFSGPTTSLKTFALPNVSTTILTTNAAVTVAQGGTGIASGNSGGVPYFSGSTAIASSATLTANALVLGGGSGATPASLGSLGSTTTVLHGNASGAPTFGAVVLTTDVSGVLPSANGGAGTVSGIMKANGSGTTSAATVNSDYAGITAPTTCTATLQFAGSATGITTSTNVCFYTKTGRTITFQVYMVLTSKGSHSASDAATVVLSGPTQTYASGTVSELNFWSAGMTFSGVGQPYIGAGSNTINLDTNDGGTEAPLTYSMVADTSRFMITGTYISD